MAQSTFDPQLRSGTRGPYAEGDAGVRQSLDVMAKKIREGRFDPAVSGWARESLQNAGIDGRDNPSVKTQVSAILEALRARAIYTPDAVGAEVISSPSATLCLRKDLCLRGGDCDDLTVALGAALLSVGIPVAIVQQSYGNSRTGEPIQAHVLIAAQDENGGWMYADPSTRAPVGYASKAKSELWIDPLGEMPAAGVGAASAEIISIGRPRGKIVRRHATKPQSRIVGMGAAPHLMPRIGFGTAGSIVTTPSDVLAYRTLWNDFVVQTAQALATCGAAWTSQSQGTTPNQAINTSQFASSPDTTTEAAFGTTYQQYSSDLIDAWNVHANMSDSDIVIEASNILQDFQNTVKRAGGFYREQVTNDCPGIPLPAAPTTSAQQSVISQIEGLGILAHGVLQILEIGAGGALQTYQSLGEELLSPFLPKGPSNPSGGSSFSGLLIGVALTALGILAVDHFAPAPKR